jgi:hypothetical protein
MLLAPCHDRKSYHGYAPGYAIVINSPTALQVSPMQIDTWNRDEMNFTGGKHPKFVPGPLPRASQAPQGAEYSGLLECPMTTRITKIIDGNYILQNKIPCDEPILTFQVHSIYMYILIFNSSWTHTHIHRHTCICICICTVSMPTLSTPSVCDYDFATLLPSKYNTPPSYLSPLPSTHTHTHAHTHTHTHTLCLPHLFFLFCLFCHAPYRNAIMQPLPLWALALMALAIHLSTRHLPMPINLQAAPSLSMPLTRSQCVSSSTSFPLPKWHAVLAVVVAVVVW